MNDGKTPVQADGDGVGTPTPSGHDPAGAGESGGGAYRQTDVSDGDNRARERPVKTGHTHHDSDSAE